MGREINYNWNNDDIDAAYILGFLNACEFTDKEVMDRLKKQLDRLKILETTPHQILAGIRNK